MSSSEELKIQQKIDMYLKNTMSESERLLFEKQMESDLDIKEQVLLQKSIGEVLFDKEFLHIPDNAKEEEIDDVASTLQNPTYQEHQKHIASVSKTYQKKQRRKKLWYFSSAAAVLLIISSVLFYTSSTSYKDAYMQYADWTEITSYVEQNETTDFAKGELLYRNQKYTEAIPFFENYIIDSNQKLLAPGLMYLGASYFHNGEIEKALQAFDQLINSNSYDRSKGYWYKLLVYLHQEDKEGINKMLLLILQDSSNFNYQKAEEIKASF